MGCFDDEEVDPNELEYTTEDWPGYFGTYTML